MGNGVATDYKTSNQRTPVWSKLNTFPKAAHGVGALEGTPTIDAKMTSPYVPMHWKRSAQMSGILSTLTVCESHSTPVRVGMDDEIESLIKHSYSSTSYSM